MTDPFDKAYADWLQSHDPATQQFRPGNDAWATSHDEPVIKPVKRAGVKSWLAYGFLFGVVRPVCEAFAWVEEKWKGRK